jgi:outer membrane protein assembly factor BamA
MAVCLFSACNVYKNVPADDYLFKGSSVTVSPGKLDRSLKSDLVKSTKPKPNSSILGIKLRLHLFNLIKEPKKTKGLFHTMKHKWGQAPVLLSSAKPKATQARLSNYLFNEGFLKARATSEIKIAKRNASISYTVDPGIRYTIRNIIYPSDSSKLTSVINKSAEKTLIKKGEYFSLNTYRKERERIDEYLKENGYFFFEPDFLLLKVDSLHEGQVDLYVTLKEGIPKKALDTWSLGNITVYSNYNILKDSLLASLEGRKENRYTIVDPENVYKPKTFEKAITIREGQVYNKIFHDLTIERLMNLNTFRFVKILYTPVPDSTLRILKSKVFLSPATKQTMRLELSGNSKSTNLYGSEVSINYRNVNIFRGAEILEAKVTGGFDVQEGGNSVSPTAYSVNGELNLYVPKILPNFIKIKTKRSPYIPKTVFMPALEFLRKPDLYTLSSARFATGYHIKRGKSIEQILRVVNLNLIDPKDITAKMDSMMEQDATLKASFERQLVIGSRYDFRFNNTHRTDHAFNQSFDGIISTSGNLVSLLIKTDVDTVGAKKLFHIPITQFVKLQADWRGYWRINNKFTLANRAIAGVAFAYGNSSTVPYSEQFIIGGTNSIKAYRIRTLGPGSYYTPTKVYEANESGEVKVELNTEIRFNMSRIAKLAAFVDAGNIWLRKEAPDKPGAGLEKGDLFGEMAVGTGIGIRFDATIMIIRFDLAFPLRKPWYPPGQRWVFNEIDLGNNTWRDENLLLNIGIGYPF